MGFLASFASRQPLPVKITKAPLTAPCETVGLENSEPQVPSPEHLSISEPHLCRGKRMSQVSSRAFRSVESRGRWTLLGWLAIGGDLENTSICLGLGICTPVFILICIPPAMDPGASRRKLTQLLLQEAEVCWSELVLPARRSGLRHWSGKTSLVVVLSEGFSWRSCSSTGSGGGCCYWQPFCGQEERKKCIGGRGET